MKKQVEIRQMVEIEIPDERIDDLVEGYNKIIYAGDQDDLIKHIVFNVFVNQINFIEGVGSVSVNDMSGLAKKKSKGESDINVKFHRDDIELEVL